MSHFCVLVIGDVEEQLQPFHEYGCTGTLDEFVKFVEAEEDLEKELKEYKEKKNAAGEKCPYKTVDDFAKDWYGYEKNDEGKWGRMTNPNAKWDWYQVGGRWSGDFFIPKHGAVGGVRGEASWTKNGAPAGIDGLRMGDVDWEAMKKRGEEKAKERWEKLEAAFGGTIPKDEIKWKSMWEDGNQYENLSREEKITIHDAQESQKLVKEVEKKHPELFGWGFSLDNFDCGKEKFIESAGEDAMVPYALVKDRKWYEKGEMGWFGMSSNEKDEEKWQVEVSKLLVECDDDDMIYLVDCHI